MSKLILHYRFLCFVVVLLMFSSCREPSSDNGGKIMLSFDDQFIDSWYAHRQIFKDYDAQVCFYVTRPDKLNEEDIKKLLVLQQDGHVIGAHGMYHRHINEFETAIAYYNQEVLPALNIMENFGLQVRSYAYPYGTGNQKIDSILFSKGLTVRYAGWNTSHQVLSKNDACYVSDTNFPVKYFAQGIDHNYNIGYVDIWLGLKRASRENSMIVLSGHKIDRQYQDYITHESKLIFLLKQCKRKNMNFYLPVMEP